MGGDCGEKKRSFGWKRARVGWGDGKVRYDLRFLRFLAQ